MSRKALKKATSTESPTTSSVAPSELKGYAEFTAPKKQLVAFVRQLANIADHKSTMPMLRHMLIRVTPTTITLVATDLNVWGIADPGFAIAGVGECCPEIKAFSLALATMPDGDVTVASALHAGVPNVEISAANGVIRATVPGLMARDFPRIPTLPDAYARIPAAPFRDLITDALPTVCKDDTRFHLAGVNLEWSGGKATVVSTDGHRLTKLQRELNQSGDGPHAVTLTQTLAGILPTDGAKAILAAIKGQAAEIQVGRKLPYLVVRNVDMTIAAKLVDAQFPPYQQVIPKGNQALVTFDRAAMLGALARAKSVVTKSNPGATITLVEGGVQVHATSRDGAEVKEVVPAEYNADHVGLAIGLNPSYLADALDLDGARATLALNGSREMSKSSKEPVRIGALDPVIVRCTVDQVAYALADAARLTVIMPTRI